MTIHGSCYELTSTRHCAGATARPDVSFTRFSQTVAGTEVGSAVPIAQPSPVPLSGYGEFLPQLHVRAQVLSATSTELVMLESESPGSDVQINGELTSNGSAQFLDLNSDANAAAVKEGRQTTAVFLTTGGDVQIALAALTGPITGFSYRTTDSYSTQNGYVGQAHFCEFEDAPPATGSSSSQAQEFLNKMSDGGGKLVLGVNSSGNDVVANSCAFAGLAPEGAVFIRPEDIGSSAEQITQSVTGNTAARFRFHPSVFVRRSSYFNGCMRRNFDSVDIAASFQSQPMKIITVDDAPTASSWMFQIDGQMIPVTILHGEGTDWRRPRDIWNNVIVPAIGGASGARSAITVGIPGSSQTQVGVLSQLPYLEYARCLPLSGTKIQQDDTLGG